MPKAKKVKTTPVPKLKTDAQSLSNALPKVLEQAARFEALSVQNGLSEAIMGFNPGGMGTPLNQVDTLFKNNRWYLISNMRQLLSECYVEHGLIQNLVNVPVDDAFRGGVEIKTKQLEPEQVEDIKAHLDRECILSGIVGQACKWNRLFGGAGILIMTDQDAATPLNIESINESSKLEFRALDMWELFPDKQATEGIDITGKGIQPEFYNYYGLRVHVSRVLKMRGLEAPSFIRPRLRGWGFSVVESLVNSINQYLKSNNLSFEVLDEFKLDIFKFKNLSQTLLSPDGTNLVQKRVALTNQQKNFQNAITMDAEDDYAQKQLTWAGIAEMMREFRIQISSDMRMPMTKLFGLSSAGFNSGEDDIENYNAMVESDVRSKSKYEIIKIIEIVCQHKYGFVPDDLKIEFTSLRILSSEQEQNVKNAKLERVMRVFTAGLSTVKETKEAINHDGLFPTQLDTTVEELQENILAPETGTGIDGTQPDESLDSESDSEMQKGVKRLAKDAKNPQDPPDQETANSLAGGSFKKES